MGIPSVLIQPLREAFRTQGLSPDIIRNDGTINPVGLFVTFFDEVEFRSSATPTIRLRTRDLLNEGGKPNAFIKWLRPTVVLRGSGGTVTIAPVGESKGGSILPGLAAALGLVGVGYALGRATR
jgi:hypothetical protein